MKRINILRCCLLFTVCFLSLSMQAQNPTYLLELRNDAQTSSTVYEFDIYLVRTGSTALEYASGQFGILMNPLIKNNGAIIATIVSGSSDPILESSHQNPTSITFADGSNAIKIAGRTPPGAGKGALISNISPGTRICRVRLSNNVDFGQYQPNLKWATPEIYPIQVSAYVGLTNILITNHSNHTTSNLANPVLNEVTSSDVYNSSNDFKLRVYPNPFSDRITIDYQLLQNSQVRISVFDTNGRQVVKLVDKLLQAGNYTIPWVPDSYPAGNYIVKLQAGKTQQISKITLIR